MKDLNHEAIEASTVYMMQRGVYLLQAHRFAGSEIEHANRLLRWADPPPDAEIIDLGSGTGSLEAAWLNMRPDLRFTLVNINKFQLDMSPKACRTILCDMENVPVDGGQFDMAIACFSIGHGDPKAVMKEAGRLLRPGGVFFIYDMLPNPDKAAEMTDLHYELHPRETMEQWASEAGFWTDFYMEPSDRRTVYDRVPELADVFHDIQPAIYRFIRGENVHI
jgi:ubiquinone/menaquinone biosynthesis C-methylase UbiE